MKFRAIYCALFLLSLSISSALADEILLTNGDRITGQIINKSDSKLLINTSFAGEISIQWSAVNGLKSEKPIRIQLEDDSLVKGKLITSEQGKIMLRSDQDSDTIPNTINIANIKAINPPVTDPQKIKYKGIANIGAYKTVGNTDNQSIHFDAEMVARKTDNRLTIGALYNQANDSGVESANNALIYGKYDHFINEKWYAFGNTLFERDKFQDLKLRSLYGVGLGHQFWENDISNLSLEAGPSYVFEDYFTESDRDFITARWALNYDRWFYEKVLQFFHFHEGIVPFEDASDLNIRSRTGVRIPLIKKFTITAEVDLDYDNKPSPGNARSDTKYLFNVGYQW